MKKRLFSLYEACILTRPLLSLIVSVLVIAWLATNIPSFTLDASADALVLEGDSALKYSREINKRYESEDFLLVTYKPKNDLLSAPVLSKLDALRGELAVLEGVSSVVTILDVPLLQSPKVSLDNISADSIRSLRSPDIDKELVRKELSDSPLYRSLLTSPDGKTTAVQVNLQRDAKYFELLYKRESLREQLRAGSLNLEQQAELAALELEFRDYSQAFNEKQSLLVDKVRLILSKYRDDAQVFLGGVPMIAADMVSFVKSDLVVFGTGIIAFIIFTLAIIFRRFIWVVLPLVTCLLSATFMLGLITWLDWRMTVISSNFVALLLIITLSITIHLVVRYRELLLANPEFDQKELVKQTASSMIKPCIYTALTTMVAFASLVVSGIRPVIDFGITVYDDFAHHPTAIETTLQGLRAKVGKERIIAVIEPRSNTMRLGVHLERLPEVTQLADHVIWYQPEGLDWSLSSVVEHSGDRAQLGHSIDNIVADLVKNTRCGDHVVFMSNGGFGAVQSKFVEALQS